MTNPTKIRATAGKEGFTEVRILASHEMENGQRKDAAGNLIPAWFITELVVRHMERIVLQTEFGTAVSKDPYLAFRFKGGAKGDKLTVRWKDNKGESRTDEAVIG